MLKALLKKVVGSRHEREAKRLQPVVAEINRVAATLASLSDEELRGKTQEFRNRIGERTDPIQERIATLREEKRRSEDAGDRERLSVQIGELDPFAEPAGGTNVLPRGRIGSLVQ